MISFFLLSGVIVWFAWSSIQEFWQFKRSDDVILEKVRHRRHLVSQLPHSAQAHEQLGDALREADKLEDAVACYERAMELESQYGSGGSGMVAGVGVEQKLRLAKLELSERTRPDQHGQSLRTRQQACMQCGHLNFATETVCTVCGSPLPVNTFLDTLRDPGMRQIILREAGEAFAMLVIVCIALYFLNSLTLVIKLIVIFAAIIVLANRFLKRIGPD